MSQAFHKLYLTTALATASLVAPASAAPGWTMEKFTPITGNQVGHLTAAASYYSDPGSTVISSSVLASNTGDNYGTRIRGYVTAPATGLYTFWESGDDAVFLSLSPDEMPANKQVIAFHNGPTNPQQWDKFASQASRPIPLVAGKRYYIEVLHKEGTGNDHLAIAWTAPDSTRVLIPLSAMETFSASVSGTPSGLTRELYNGIPGDRMTSLTNSPAFQAFSSAVSVQQTGLAPSNIGDNYGVRLRGTITPQVSGDYTFWEYGNDEVHLFLSPTESAADKQLVASHYGNTNLEQWDKFASQKSRTISLTAGKSYYIEVLHKEATGTDYCAVAWTPPGGVREILPANVLNTYAPAEGDADDDLLPDSYETALGLNPAERADGAADADLDGISNLREYRNFANPSALDDNYATLVDEVWLNVPGDRLNQGIYKTAATRFPDYRGLVTTTSAPHVAYDYVRRIRGYIVAPTTGTYQFWGTANDDIDFHLSTSASKFNLQHIIRQDVFSDGMSYDIHPSCKSIPITLTAGQKYYFELWHKQGGGASTASVVWKTPTGSRESISSHFLRSFGIDSDDQDDDGLSDAYELAKGLSITDDGRSAGSTDGAYGDLDGDGLTNSEEQKYNTAANLADSDGDGVSDWDEVNFFGSATLANDIGAFTEVSTISGASYTAVSGEWLQFNNTAMQKCRRGSVTYPVTVPSSGIHAFKFTIQSVVDGAKNEQYDFHLKLNGKHLVHKTITILPNGIAHLAILSPWLLAGETYNLELFVDNSYNWRRVSINQLQILKAGGTDSNSNDRADWTEIRIHDTNGLDTAGVIHSRTSPAVVEGKARYLNLLTTNSPAPVAAPNGRFFTEVPLTAGSATELNFSFENKALEQTASVYWLPTNLKTASSLTIRQGDSLLLTAFNDAENASLESYTYSMNGSTVSGSANIPTPQLFASSGTHTIITTHTAADGSVSTHTCTVTVLAKVNITAPNCLVGYSRNWTHPALPGGATLSVDSQVQAVPSGIANTLTLTTATPINQPIIVKSSNGLILANGEIKSASFRSSDQTGAFVLETFPTYQNLQMPVIVYGDLGSMQIQCNIIIGGVTYTDGSISKTINKNSFDVNHQCDLFYKKPLTAHSNCHQFIFGY